MARRHTLDASSRSIVCLYTRCHIGPRWLVALAGSFAGSNAPVRYEAAAASPRGGGTQRRALRATLHQRDYTTPALPTQVTGLWARRCNKNISGAVQCGTRHCGRRGPHILGLGGRMGGFGAAPHGEGCQRPQFSATTSIASTAMPRKGASALPGSNDGLFLGWCGKP